MCCQWKNGSTPWEKLSKLKESHLVQKAEFAVVQGIDHEPTFNCWVKHVLKKRDRMIASILPYILDHKEYKMSFHAES